MKKLIYIGLRVNGDRLNNCFLLGKKQYFWRKGGYLTIGDLYSCSKDFKMSKQPESLGPSKATEKQIEKWKMIQSFERDKFQKIRAAKEMDQPKFWYKTIYELHAIHEELSWSERLALISKITKLISWGKE